VLDPRSDDPSADAATYASMCRESAWRRRLKVAGFRVLEQPAGVERAAPLLAHSPGSFANLVNMTHGTTKGNGLDSP